MAYLLLLLPLFLLILSYKKRLQFNKLKGTGRVPDIMSAKRQMTLFTVLAVLFLICIVFFIAQLEF
nr:putative integral membrane protein [Mucilaginibacter sp. X5P1]